MSDDCDISQTRLQVQTFFWRPAGDQRSHKSGGPGGKDAAWRVTEIYNEFGLLSSGIINALTCCEFLFQKKENCDYKKEKSSSTADFRLISYSFLRVLMLFSVSVVCVHVSWVPCWIFNHRHHLAPASHLASPWRASPQFSWFLVISRWLERQWPVDASFLRPTGSSPSSTRYARIFRSAIRGCDLWNEVRRFYDACPWRWVSAYPVRDTLWVPTFALEAAAWLCRYFSMSLSERICGQLTRYSDKLGVVRGLRRTFQQIASVYKVKTWKNLWDSFKSVAT